MLNHEESSTNPSTCSPWAAHFLGQPESSLTATQKPQVRHSHPNLGRQRPFCCLLLLSLRQGARWVWGRINSTSGVSRHSHDLHLWPLSLWPGTGFTSIPVPLLPCRPSSGSRRKGARPTWPRSPRWGIRTAALATSSLSVLHGGSNGLDLHSVGWKPPPNVASI